MVGSEDGAREAEGERGEHERDVEVELEGKDRVLVEGERGRYNFVENPTTKTRSSQRQHKEMPENAARPSLLVPLCAVFANFVSLWSGVPGF